MNKNTQQFTLYLALIRLCTVKIISKYYILNDYLDRSLNSQYQCKQAKLVSRSLPVCLHTLSPHNMTPTNEIVVTCSLDNQQLGLQFI